MECGINFRSPESQEEYVNTEFGKSYVIQGLLYHMPLILTISTQMCCI